MIGLKRGTVILCEHDPQWEVLLRESADELKTVLGDACIAVMPVGSTAVPDLPAKPILDLAVGTEDFEKVLRKVPELEEKGYLLRKDERPRELFFAKGDLENDFITHHIHVIPYGGEEWDDYFVFREYLLFSPKARREYGEVKTALAERYPQDRASYTAGKAEVIRKLINEAKRHT